MGWLKMSIGLAAVGASAAIGESPHDAPAMSSEVPSSEALSSGAMSPHIALREGAALNDAPLEMRSVLNAPSRRGQADAAVAGDAGQSSRRSLRLSGAAGLKLAEKLFEDGALDEAQAILSALHGADALDVDQMQVMFLLGMIAVQREDHAAAVEYFRSILDDRPDLVRVRLELARALFALKRDQAAAYHFRLALADGLPEATKANIRLFLNQIQARKVWRVNAQFGVAPDSNVNAGPKDRTVELFGLPFQLDDAALERSGFGLASSMSASYFPRLTRRWRAELRGGGSITDYENIQFDDAFIFAEAGPRFETPGMSVSALAAASRRYFGGEGFTTSIGGKAAFSKGLNARTWASLRFSGAHLDYDDADFRDGPVYSAGLTLRRALSRLSTAQAGVTVTREQTADQVLRNTQYLFNASYARELPYGLTVQAGPDLYLRRFDNADPMNAGIDFRRDWTYGGSVFVTKRDWRVGGFAPIVSYQYLVNESNADRFDFTRHRANVGLTRTF